MKSTLSSLLDFTKKERRGILILLILTIMVNSIPLVYSFFYPAKKIILQSLDYQLLSLDSLNAIRDSPPHKQYDYKKYEDYSKSNRTDSYLQKADLKIDVNKADSLQWLSLPGIGPRLSGRIVSFREKLGGFYSINQVGETYGLQDSVFRKIKSRLTISSGIFRFIHINSDSFSVLAGHPYIRYRLARSINDYRHQHGPFQKMEDLLQIITLQPEELEKMRPYLKTDAF